MANNETIAIENFINFCDDMMIVEEATVMDVIGGMIYMTYRNIKYILKNIFNAICKLINKFRTTSDIVISAKAKTIIDEIEKCNLEYFNESIDIGEYTQTRINSLFSDLNTIINTDQIGSDVVHYEIKELENKIKMSKNQISRVLKEIEILERGNKDSENNNDPDNDENIIRYNRYIKYYQNQIRLSNMILSYK